MAVSNVSTAFVPVRVNVSLIAASWLCAAVIVIGLAISAAVGLSRVYLRVHYVSDVNSGAANRTRYSAPARGFGT